MTPRPPDDRRGRPTPRGAATILVLAKEPRPGRVKTRLTPPFTPAQAADLARAALEDTLAAVCAAPVGRRVLVLDGDPGPWVPLGVEVLPQRDGSLGDRLAGAFTDAFASSPSGPRSARPCLLVGMDTPQLNPELLLAGLPADDGAVTLGPTPDGGWWGIGMDRPWPDLFSGVPMSTAETWVHQVAQIETVTGRPPVALPEQRDVDYAGDARAVAATAPSTRFAHQLHAIEGRSPARGRS